MSSAQTRLLRRVEFLEQQLRDRDMADAARRTAAVEVNEKISAEAQAQTRAAAKLAEAQSMRRNAWINHLLTTAPPGKPLDVMAVESGIPTDPAVWPPGFDESLVAFGTTKLETPQAVTTTTLGKLMGESK